MNTYINKKNIFWMMGIIFLILPTIVKADDDEECLLCDAMVGVTVAVCEEFSACRSFMLLTGMIVIFFSLLMCIFGGEDTRRDMWDSAPSYRSMGSTAAGYGVTRAFLNSRR